jgi:hypothetical protein
VAQLTEKRIRAIQKRIVGIEEASPWVKVLVYGRNGTEKTRFAATAPKVLIVDINEKGTKSARQFKGAKVFPVRKWEDVAYLYWYLRDADHDFESVAIDNLTTLQQLCMTHVLKEAGDRDPNKDPAIASKRDWGKVTELLKPLILNLRNLDMHVIFIAQERTEGDEDEGYEHMPDMSRGNRGVATGAVDIIGRTYQKEVRKGKRKGKKKGSEEAAWEPRMLVGPHENFTTKDRTGQLPRIVRNPTVPMFIEAAQSIGSDKPKPRKSKKKSKRS